MKDSTRDAGRFQARHVSPIGSRPVSRGSRVFLNVLIGMIIPGILGFTFFAGFLTAKATEQNKIMTLLAPNPYVLGQPEPHYAELFRSDHPNRKYSVKVDGRQVYDSPAFSSRNDLAFRETLLWDPSGRVVILEVAGHRIFGYDATSRRRITSDELLALKLPPEPPLQEYHFDSEWPGIGRVSPPD